MKYINIIYLFVFTSVLQASFANAAIGLDRTRVIFNGDKNSMTINITNQNEKLPYLAQVWLEDNQEQKITTGPIIATPPVMRLEPGAQNIVQLATTPSIMKYPQDRESLFYFNLREIPPRSKQANTLQIALQTKLKLFYRPDSIIPEPNSVWQNEMILHKVAGGYRIENPTPYYITIIGLGADENSSKVDEFDPVMIAPKSSKKVMVDKSFNTAYLTYINDYGGRPTLALPCIGGLCSYKKQG